MMPAAIMICLGAWLCGSTYAQLPGVNSTGQDVLLACQQDLVLAEQAMRFDRINIPGRCVLTVRPVTMEMKQ